MDQNKSGGYVVLDDIAVDNLLRVCEHKLSALVASMPTSDVKGTAIAALKQLSYTVLQVESLFDRLKYYKFWDNEAKAIILIGGIK